MGRRAIADRPPRHRRRDPTHPRPGRPSPLVVLLAVAILVGFVAWTRGLSLNNLPGELGAWLDGLAGTADGPRGRVVDVRDGDTIVVAGVAVRIAKLDCAERDTVEGRAATERMRELVADREVACSLEGRRSYDREVGTCALARTGDDLGEILIAERAYGRWR